MCHNYLKTVLPKLHHISNVCQINFFDVAETLLSILYASTCESLPLKIFVQMKEQLLRLDNPVSIRRLGLAGWFWTDLRWWCWFWRLACIRVHSTRTTRRCRCQNSEYHCPERRNKRFPMNWQMKQLASIFGAINRLAFVSKIYGSRHLDKRRRFPYISVHQNFTTLDCKQTLVPLLNSGRPQVPSFQ